ncbi:MAG: hypothetical protein AB1465_01830 [Patescibacteria group bacterium]
MNVNDFQEILKLCKEIGGRYIFVEGGKPSFVLMNIEEFKKIFGKKVRNLSKEELIEKINKEIAAWREGQKEKEVEDILDEEKDEKKDEAKYDYNIEEKLNLEK